MTVEVIPSGTFLPYRSATTITSGTVWSHDSSFVRFIPKDDQLPVKELQTSSITSANQLFKVMGSELALDPIEQYYLQNCDRQHAPERPIYIEFALDSIKIYEEDVVGSRWLRTSIPYQKISAILVNNSNSLISPKEVEALDLVTELRSTQASLHETAQALRASQAGVSNKKDAEITELLAQKQLVNEKYQRCLEFLKEEEKSRIKIEQELSELKEQIAQREKILSTLEID